MIRPATVEDAPALAAVHVGAMLAGYAEFADDLSALPGIAERVPGWRAWLTGQGAGWTWLAEDDDAIVGVVAARPGHVDELMVLPDRFGCGVGGALLAHAEAAIEAGGSASATLCTYAANARSRGLYEHHGWTLDGDADPGTLGPQVRYRKELG